MIAPTQICCVIEPVDMRRGLDSLSQWIQTSLGTTPCDGTAYAFSNRSKTRLKLLIWDGNSIVEVDNDRFLTCVIKNKLGW